MKEKPLPKKPASVIEFGVLYPDVLGVNAGYMPLGGNEHTSSSFGNCTAEQ
jgi:hypothetical protein